MKPSIACVILHYRNARDTLDCLKSLGEAGPSSWKIFLVNNSPEDGSSAELEAGLRATGARYAMLVPGFNAGFAGGCNAGMRAALAEGFSHVLLLNNDTLVDAGFVRETERAVAAHPGDVLAGHVTDEAGNPTHNVGRLSRWTGRVRHVFEPRPGEPIDFVSGCLAILPRSALEKAGLFDERLFMYCEDMELCMRLRAAGARVRYVPAIRVRHKFHPASTRTGVPKEYYIQRNQTYVILRSGTLRQRLMHLVYLAAMPAYKLARRPRLFAQAVRGARDGLLGRMGRRHRLP